MMFIDEIDTIGGARGGTGMGIMSLMGGNVGGQILNVILSQISGINEPGGVGHRIRVWFRDNFGVPYSWRQPNVIIIGSTNKDLLTLDAALLRPGRLEEHIEFPLPDRHDLELLIDYYLNRRAYDKMIGVPHAEDCEVEAMAWIAQGTSQAGVERAINSAKRLAAAQKLEEINLELWTQAITEAMMGLKQPMPLTERDKRLLSIHESGHVYAAKAFANQIVPFATIERYGGSGKLGHIRHMPEEQHVLSTGRDIEESLVVSLASLAAEELLGERTPGTAADLDNVRRLTLLLISQGMIGDPWMLDQPKETGGRTVGIALPIATITDKGRKVAAEYFRFRKAEILEAMQEDLEVLEDIAQLLAEKKAVKNGEITECIAGRLKQRQLRPFNGEGKDENLEK